MSATSHAPAARAGAAGAAPELRFTVHSAAPLGYAAVPTLKFGLGIEAPGHEAIRSALLDVQIQIAARRRGYPPEAVDRLLELFGTPDRWSTTLRTLPWHRTTIVVPQFVGTTSIDLTVPCTYDLEVSASRYLAALDDGEIPLEFLFSGSVFFLAPDRGLQIARIPLDHEVVYGMPVAVWRAVMDAHFPDSAWIRLDRECYDRLCAFKARHAFASWKAAVDSLLAGRSEP